MGTAHQPKTAKGAATRRAILEAAELEFGELGFDRASVANITRRAGVAQGTFYLYFPDKKAAFIELVHELNHRMRRSIAESIADLDDRLEQERIGFKTFFDWVARHRTLYRVVRESEFVDSDTYKWHYNTLAEGYVAGLIRAQERHQIVDDISASTIAWILMGIAEFLGGRWVLWAGQAPPDDVFEDVFEFISRALRPRGEQ